jgi:hypothetical protein
MRARRVLTLGSILRFTCGLDEGRVLLQIFSYEMAGDGKCDLKQCRGGCVRKLCRSCQVVIFRFFNRKVVSEALHVVRVDIVVDVSQSFKDLP